MQYPTTPTWAFPVRSLQQVDRARQVLGGRRQVQRHHQLPGPVGLGRGLAVVQVGGERGEPGCGEAVGDVLDVRDETPPLLDHDHPGPITRR